jgi:hypothetical protein
MAINLPKKMQLKVGATFRNTCTVAFAPSLNIANLNDVVVDSAVMGSTPLSATSATYPMSIEIVDGANFIFKVTAGADITRNFKTGTGAWDIRFSFPNGDVFYTETIELDIRGRVTK